MSAVRSLPKGWTVEALGLIEAVQFRNGNMELCWCDGQWTVGSARMQVPARCIPEARTMKEARTIGTKFINDTEGDES